MTELTEAQPDRINNWCVTMRRHSPQDAATMVEPLVKLNYNKLDQRTVNNIEDALFYALTGEDRATGAPPGRFLSQVSQP